MSDRSRTNSLPSFAVVFPTAPIPVRPAKARRSWTVALLAGAIGLLAGSPAVSQQVCKPTLTITDVQFSKWQRPTMERKWTATVAVDASRCAANTAGYFEIGFLRLIENGVDIEFTEEFAWMSPEVTVGVDFWANEAVGRTWINKVSACPCAR
jgi:hypothetical protein